ncbi:MAG: hypothetical protein M3Y30_00100 [Gemmatimonadota bacterium]|nr:hypothetical protein [Gemmatimonadota bacterium]
MKSSRRLIPLVAPFVLVPLLQFCYTKQPVDLSVVRADSSASRARISAVTLIDGREINFDDTPRPVVLSDTLRGWVQKISVLVPADSVQRVWLTKLSPGRTALAVVVPLVVVGGIVAAISAAKLVSHTPSQSCPFIYSWDGNRYVFDAEPYGGAITKGLERDDYGELPSLVDDHGIYRLMMTNEVDETQYTNQLRLFVVDHASGVTIKPDEFGRFYAFDSLLAPTSARDADGRDLRPWLAATDHLVWEPVAPPDSAHGARQQITLTFAKPPTATKAFLVARVSTGLWGSQMIRQFSQLRGTALNDWYAAIDSSPTKLAALRNWNLREELYALKLSVDEPTGWEVRGILPGGGPFLAADRVVPLDLSHVRGDSLHIRIRPPYGFWALNSFVIAYGTAGEVQVTTLDPATAHTSAGRDVLPELASADDRYYTMPDTGDYGYVTFAAPPLAAGKSRTVFAHTRGYYRLHLAPTNSPDSVTLARFLETPDAAAMFAAERYAKSHPRIAMAH